MSEREETHNGQFKDKAYRAYKILLILEILVCLVLGCFVFYNHVLFEGCERWGRQISQAQDLPGMQDFYIEGCIEREVRAITLLSYSIAGFLTTILIKKILKYVYYGK